MAKTLGEMNKKQLTVACVIFFCLPVTSAFAKSENFIVRQRLYSAPRTHLTSGGEFTKLSANFNKPSFSISSPNKRYPHSSKYIKRNQRSATASNTGEFSKPSFRIKSNTGEFSRPSFTKVSKKGEFSRNSFTIASQGNGGKGDSFQGN